MNPFHLALPVADLDETVRFYTERLGCTLGRTATHWVDLDFFGHQVTLHLAADSLNERRTSPVDGDAVPVRHFGVVLAWDDWEALATRLSDDGVSFLIAPRVRFAGEPGEQGTFFVRDPSGNALELKGFRDLASLFATK